MDVAGNPITDDVVLERCRGLGIPPAWREVWIAPAAPDHIQATGIDAAGRRQYLYHPPWRETQDQLKFDRMLDFADALPGALMQCQIGPTGAVIDAVASRRSQPSPGAPTVNP